MLPPVSGDSNHRWGDCRTNLIGSAVERWPHLENAPSGSVDQDPPSCPHWSCIFFTFITFFFYFILLFIFGRAVLAHPGTLFIYYVIMNKMCIDQYCLLVCPYIYIYIYTLDMHIAERHVKG